MPPTPCVTFGHMQPIFPADVQPVNHRSAKATEFALAAARYIGVDATAISADSFRAPDGSTWTCVASRHVADANGWFVQGADGTPLGFYRGVLECAEA